MSLMTARLAGTALKPRTEMTTDFAELHQNQPLVAEWVNLTW
jgi:hypothetical protein